MSQRIGLYFGSFNPVHHGHLILATFILQHAPLDQLWFIVSPQNPLKPSVGLLNEYQRLHLVRLAIEDVPGLKVSDIEFKLPRPSYTIDTLTYLQEKYPDHRFSVIMGSDSYRNIAKWKNYAQLLEHYPLYVYLRPGHPVEPLSGFPEPLVLKAPLLEISATLIRENIRKGHSIKFLVPDIVAEEIERNGYYRNTDKPQKPENA